MHLTELLLNHWQFGKSFFHSAQNYWSKSSLFIGIELHVRHSPIWQCSKICLKKLNFGNLCFKNFKGNKSPARKPVFSCSTRTTCQAISWSRRFQSCRALGAPGREDNSYVRVDKYKISKLPTCCNLVSLITLQWPFVIATWEVSTEDASLSQVLLVIN